LRYLDEKNGETIIPIIKKPPEKFPAVLLLKASFIGY